MPAGTGPPPSPHTHLLSNMCAIIYIQVSFLYKTFHTPLYSTYLRSCWDCWQWDEQGGGFAVGALTSWTAAPTPLPPPSSTSLFQLKRQQPAECSLQGRAAASFPSSCCLLCASCQDIQESGVLRQYGASNGTDVISLNSCRHHRRMYREHVELLVWNAKAVEPQTVKWSSP